MTIRAARRGLLALGAALAAGFIAASVTVFALAGRPPGPAFPPLAAAPAPAGWPRPTLPDGTAVLSYPPSLRRVAGDPDSVSAARLSPAGTYLRYLNATPRQGSESLRYWGARQYCWR